MRHFVLFLLLWLSLVSCRTAAEPDLLTGQVAGLAIEAPASIAAGQDLPLVITADSAPANTPLTVIATGSYGPRVYQGRLVDRQAKLVVPAGDTTVAGLMTLTATAGAASAETEVMIDPGEPVAPVTPLVGARSIIADGEHWAMIVAIPFDRFGNPVATGRRLTVRALHPGDRLEVDTILTEHLLGWKRVWSGTQAGRTTIGVEALGRSGPEADLLEVAGWPTPFSLAAEERDLVADGRQLVTIRTDTLVDRYGNILPDGTLVTFTVGEPSRLQRIVPAYVLDGVAETPIQAPSQPGKLVVRAAVYGVESAPLVLEFQPGLGLEPFPLRIRIAPWAGWVTFSAGPILGPLRQFVPDGSPVSFIISREGVVQERLEAETVAGLAVASARLVELAPGRYELEAQIGAAAVTSTFTVAVDE